MRVIVCGGRDFEKRKTLYDVLDAMHAETPITFLAEGGEPNGADRMAGDWAILKGIEHKTYRANWDAFGLSAGPRRNSYMLAHARPDRVVAFPTYDKSGTPSRGTADMMRKARVAGVRVDKVSAWGLVEMQK